MNNQAKLVKMIKQVMFEQNTNLLQAAGQVMNMVTEASDAIALEHKTTGKVTR